MGFGRRLLNDDESVAVDVHPHWTRVAAPVLSLVVAIAAGVATPLVSSPGTLWRTIVGWVALLVIVSASVWTIARYAAWSTTRLIVTNHRVIYRYGWLRRRGVDVPLDRIINVGISQRIRDRVLGVGELVIETAGESGRQSFGSIGRPAQVQNRIYTQMRIDREGAHGAQGDRRSVGNDLASQLERLEGLADRGVITREEFEIHKRRLFEE